MKSDQFIHQYSTMKNSVYYYVSMGVNKLLLDPIIYSQRLNLYCFGVLAYISPKPKQLYLFRRAYPANLLVHHSVELRHNHHHWGFL